MNEEQSTLSKDEAFRLFEQSELSDFIEVSENIKIKILGNFKNKLSNKFAYFLYGAGILVGTAGLLTVTIKCKLFRFL
jgi:hypothetical protein